MLKESSTNAWGVDLCDPQLVSYQGKTVAFARARGKKTDTLFYRVLDTTLELGGSTDNARWSDWFRFYFPDAPPTDIQNQLAFDEQIKNELRIAGMDLITLNEDISIQGNRKLVEASDSAFFIITDDKYIYCFRHSHRDTLYFNRLILTGDISTTEDGETSAAYNLEIAWEARFQHSGHKDSPAGDEDLMGYYDPSGNPFATPTIELNRIKSTGLFAVTRVPTAVPDTSIWYFLCPRENSYILHAVFQSDSEHTDFSDWDESQEIMTILTGKGVPASQHITPSQELAPAMTFYAEHEPVKSMLDESIEIQRSGRLMFAAPVTTGIKGLEKACMVYDFGIAADGRIPRLQEGLQTAYLADGSVINDEFVALKDVPRYPTDADLEKTEIVIDKMPLSRILLGQLKPATSLSLKTFSDGLLHLYYGAQNIAHTHNSQREYPMTVAQFDCRVSRLLIELPWKQTDNNNQGVLNVVARRAGITLAGTKITVSDSIFQKNNIEQIQPDLCDVTIRYGDKAGLPDEKWLAVPRELDAFSDVLNGKAAGDAAANADVLSGLKPFYDFEGDQTLIRVPVDTQLTEASGTDTRPRLTFVSSLPDIDLESLKISRMEKLLNYHFTFKADDILISSTWQNVPENPVKYFEIFTGSASEDIYHYSTIIGNDTPLFALDVDISEPPTPLVLYPKSTGINASTTLQIEADEADHRLLNLTVTIDGKNTPFKGLSRDAVSFVAELRNNPDFTNLFGIAGSHIEGNVLETNTPTGPIVGRDKNVLFDLIIPQFPESSRISVDSEMEYLAGNQKHEYSGSNPDSNPATRSIGLFVSHFSNPDVGAVAYLQNTSELSSQKQSRTIGDSHLPRNGSWQIRTPRPYQLSLSSHDDAMEIDIEQSGTLLPRAHRLTLQPAFTIEGWVEPLAYNQQGAETENSTIRRLFSFHRSHESEASAAMPGMVPNENYMLSLDAQHAVSFESFDVAEGMGSYAFSGYTLKEGITLAPPEQFSWEFWIQPDREAAPEHTDSNRPDAGIIELIDFMDNRILPFIVGIARDRKIQIAWNDRNTQRIESSERILPYEEYSHPAWSHVCVVGRKSDDKWTLILYINGEQDKIIPDVSFPITPENRNKVRLRIGAGLWGQAALFGKLSSLRYWGRALTPAEIQIDRFLSVDNATPSLWGAWPLSRIVEKAGTRYFENVSYTGSGLNAMLYEYKQVITTKADGVFQSLIGNAGGGRTVQAIASLRSSQWNHIAMRYRAGGAVNLNTGESFDRGRFDYVNLGDSIILNPGQAFSIDSWIWPGSSLSPRTIMSRWIDSVDKNAGDRQSFRVYLDSDGVLHAEVNCITYDNTGKSAVKTVLVGASDHKLTNDQAYHIGLTFRIASKIEKRSGEDKTEVKKYAPQLTLLLDGLEVATNPGYNNFVEYSGIEVLPTDTDTYLGCLGTPNEQTVSDRWFFRGAIGQTQLWDQFVGKELLFPEIYSSFFPSQKLKPVCRWRFQEQQGLIAYDSADSKIDGKLTSTELWTPFNETSQLEFFANGNRVWLTQPSSGTLLQSGNQFRIGAAAVDIDGVIGNVAEVRIWSSFKSDEELQNSAFTRLSGRERGLLAYWNFNDGNAADQTGGANDGHLIGSATIIAGNYPVSNEPPAVRNVYGGVINAFQGTTDGRIAAGEYGDVQDSDSAEPDVILKRIVIGNPTARWREPIGIGRLEVRYLGQAQSKPKLIGYIEGAPPLPGENLTVPYYESPFLYHKYVDTATVSVEEENLTELSFSSGNAWSNDFSLKLNAGLFWMSRLNIKLMIPPSVNEDTDAFDLEQRITASLENQWAFGQSVELNRSLAWSRSISDQMGAGGDWEPHQENPENYTSPALGRRYLLGNLGYALVESIIVDHYAIFIPRTGIAIGTIFLPNPDSQPDRNIVLFPLNSKKTKAGCLDGKIGWERDPEIVSHSYTGLGSYYRPDEAYRMEQELHMQKIRALTFSAQFDARVTGRSRNSLEANERLDEVKEPSPSHWEDGGFITDPENPHAKPTWGICNRYVWTANGGLHSETETFSTTRSSSHGSNFGWDFRGGFNGQGNFTVKGFGMGLGFDVAYAHHLQAHLSQGKSLSQGLSLSVKVEGEANLKKWNPDAGQEGRKGAFSAGDHPGKVQAYRFMSFYLPAHKKHGKAFKKDVVDQVWLKSRDATAVMLRNMVDGEPWRVLHRVTYVDRVPPKVATRPAYTQKKKLESIVNLQGNQELVRLIMQEIEGIPTPLAVGQATAKVMNPVEGKAILNEKIEWWGQFLEKAGTDKNTAAVLDRIICNVLTYINTGIASGQIS